MSESAVYYDGDFSVDVAIAFDPAMSFAQPLTLGWNGKYTTSYQKAFGSIQLLDESQDPVSAVDQATTAELTQPTGEIFRFEIIEIDSDYFGRLIRFEDRTGRGTSLTYKSWTPAELSAAPDRQWQIDDVDADDGTSLTFHYDTSQVSGRWVVNQIDLPNGESTTYTYAGGHLTEVDHPDGTTSIFAYSTSSYNDVVTFFDAAASSTHRVKEVYLSQFADTYSEDDHIMNSASLLTRVVLNGSDEVGFFSFMSSQGLAVYEGESRLKLLGTGAVGSPIRYFQDGWEAGEYDEGEGVHYPITGTPDQGVSWATNHELFPNDFTDERGITTEYEYDADGWVTHKYYPDGTFEAWCYNDFKQPTRYRDREANVTYWTYDARGNMLTKSVGLIDTTDVSGGGGGGYGYYGGTPNYNPCETENDEQTDDYAVSTWEYYAASHANEFLLEAAIDPLGNETNYEYDSNDRLTKIIQPPDVTSGTRAETEYTYDTAGRLSTVTDPEEATITYTYDARSRLIKTTYADGTTERTFYGAASSGDENLVVKRADRRGVVTNYAYDDSGRLTQTTYAAALMDASGNESAVSDASVTTVETLTYLNGTDKVATRVRAGEKTEYTYDYRHRVVGTKVYANTGTALETSRTYVNNQLFKSEDAYGRTTFYAYDASDGRLIRTIQGTVPSVSYANFAAVLNATRDADGTANSTSIITDYLYDAAGQQVALVDARGIVHATEYDSRGRSIVRVQAAEWADETPTSVSARTETDYDDASNVVEIRHPRYFDSSDTNGYQKAKTTMAYNGRNLLASRTEAPGTSEAATEEFTYTLDGRQDTHTDARDNDWVTIYATCCDREMATVDPLGHGVITNTDANGNVTHQVWVADVSTHSDYNNPTDAKTLREVTTRYDERNRPVARTVWLSAQSTIDPDDPPIATNPANGLTSTWEYDDDLDDSSGLDDDFSTHLTGLSLGTNADGSASLVTNPEGERTLTIQDGRGRTLRTVQLDSSDAALTQTTITYDATTSISGYGTVLETTQANLLAETTKRRTDGAGRTIESVDALAKLTTFAYDAAGNRLQDRDPNSIGQDCDYDELGRDTRCTDTGSDTTETAYDLAGNVTIETDAKDNDTTHVYDARGRRLTTTDRISAVTTWTWDAGGNELSMTDAENSTTSYAYDDAGRRTQTTWPDHNPADSPGDPDYGITTTTYDALGRVLRTTDQLGETITHVFDLAGRRTNREYRTLPNSPSGTIADQDTFTYDDAGRLLTAVKGRYSNTVTFTYDDGGRRATEGLTTGGQTYTVSLDYDNAGRMSEITYPDGTAVDRTYTDRGQLETVDYQTSDVASFAYDDGGRETSRTFGNSLVTTTSYITGENLIASLNNTAVGNYSYGYDANDNKTAETISGVMSNYGFDTPSGYDDEDRLTNWERDDANLDLSWVLSDVGDWDSHTTNTVTENRTHNAVHELTAIASTSLTYDAKGNLTSDEAGIDYAWDMDNMLSEAAVPASPSRGIEGTHTYAYDALGRRTSKTVDDAVAMTTETTVFVSLTQPIAYSPWAGQVLAEYPSGTAAGTPLRKYAYGSYIDEPLVLIDRTAAGATAAGTDEPFYYHKNQQYSLVALSNSSGNVTERDHYTPYGQTTITDAAGTTVRTTSDAGNPYTYTGRRRDTETGLHYFRARYVLGLLGRFVNRDPVEYIDGVSLYSSYFSLDGVDPSGLTKNPKNPVLGGGGGYGSLPSTGAGGGGRWGGGVGRSLGGVRSGPARSYPRTTNPGRGGQPRSGGRTNPGGTQNPGGSPKPGGKPNPIGDPAPSPGGAPPSNDPGGGGDDGGPSDDGRCDFYLEWCHWGRDPKNCPGKGWKSRSGTPCRICWRDCRKTGGIWPFGKCPLGDHGPRWRGPDDSVYPDPPWDLDGGPIPLP